MVCLYYGQTVTSATTKILFEIIKQCCYDVWHSTISHLACVGREMKAGRGWVAGELRSGFLHAAVSSIRTGGLNLLHLLIL